MEPEFITSWRSSSFSTQDALDCFDGLAPIDVPEMLGLWQGTELPTGHPLDGVLTDAGWFGKSFGSEDDVAPLLFGPVDDLRQVDPSRLPLETLSQHPRLAHERLAQELFRHGLPLLSTNEPAARLRRVEYRDVLSAAMIYDRQPIIDHFRRIDETRVLGLMDLRYFEQAYFFCLEKVAVAERPGQDGI